MDDAQPEIFFPDFEFFMKSHNKNLQVADGYFTWLQQQSALPGEAEVSVVEPGLYPLHRFSADASNTVGWRHVAMGAVLLKAESYFQEQKWNPSMPAMLVYTNATGSFEYVKGHQRIVALHMLCNFFFASKRKMPDWLLSMCQRVPATPTQLSRDQAALKGLANAVDAESHTTRWSYIVVALLVASRDMKAEEFREKMAALTRRAEDLQTKHLYTVASRVGRVTLQLLRQWQDEHLQGGSALPLSFWRGSGLRYLLPSVERKGGTEGQTFTNETEQYYFVSRLLNTLQKRIAAHCGSDALDSNVASGLAAALPEKFKDAVKLKAINYTMVRKLLCQAFDFSGPEEQKLDEAWCQGLFDFELSQPCAVETAKTWPAVQALLNKRKRDEQLTMLKLAEAEKKEAMAEQKHEDDRLAVDADCKAEAQDRARKLWRSCLAVQHGNHKIEIAKVLEELTQKLSIESDAAAEDLAVSARQKWEVVRALALPDLSKVAPTVAVMDGVLEEPWLAELCLAVDCVTLALCPVEPQAAWDMERRLAQIVGDKQPCRRVNLILSKPFDGATVQSLVVIGGNPDAPEASMQGRIGRSEVFRLARLDLKLDLDAGPRADNGHHLWSEQRHSAKAWMQIFAALNIKLLPTDLVLEASPHWGLLGAISETGLKASAQWKGLIKPGAHAKAQHLTQISTLAAQTPLGEEVHDPSSTHAASAGRALASFVPSPVPDEVKEMHEAETAKGKAAAVGLLLRHAKTVVATLADPVPAGASPPSDSCLAKSKAVLTGLPRLASELQSAGLCALPSRFVDGVAIWAARSFKKGEVVFAEPHLTWHRGEVPSSGEVEVSSAWQVTIKRGVKTVAKLSASVPSSCLLGSMHLIGEGVMDGEGNFNVLEAKVDLRPFSAPVLNFVAAADIEPWSRELAVQVRVVSDGLWKADGVASTSEPTPKALTDQMEEADGVSPTSEPTRKALTDQMEDPLGIFSSVDDGEAARLLSSKKDEAAKAPTEDDEEPSGPPVKKARKETNQEKQPAPSSSGAKVRFFAKESMLYVELLGGRKRKVPRDTTVCNMFGGEVLPTEQEGAVEVALTLQSKVALVSPHNPKELLKATTLKDVMHSHKDVTSVEGKKARNQKERVFWLPEPKDMPMVQAFQSTGTGGVSLVFVLRKEAEKLVLGGAMLVLNKQVKIPKGSKEIPLSSPQDDEEDEEDAEEDAAQE